METAVLYTGEMKKAAEESGVTDQFIVDSVVQGSPADKAGIQVGDRIVRVGGAAPADLQLGTPGFDEMTKVFNEGTGKPLPIFVRRRGELLELTSTPVQACDYPVLVQNNSVLNAFADGSKIVIFSGMMKFASTDEELALVVGHELAHNIRDHISSKRTNAFIGIALDAVVQVLTGYNPNLFSQIGAHANSPEFEAEADYVGLYIIARAGFAIDAAPGFWRRMAVENPDGISHSTTHPATNDRFVALQAAIAEIDAKKAAGAALVPNEKKKPSPPTE
jgi:predicted Zn-dependent protease